MESVVPGFFCAQNTKASLSRVTGTMIVAQAFSDKFAA